MGNHYKFKLSASELESVMENHHKALGADFTEETLKIAITFRTIRPAYEILLIKPDEIKFNFSPGVSRKLDKADEVALFVATLGAEASEIIDSFKSDPFAYYAADHLASLYAEALADFVHRKIGLIANDKGYSYSNRYSPGYCGWRVSDQKLLFAAFPDLPCNVALTEGSLMFPVKSVSGIVAMGKEVVYASYGCEKCRESCLNKLIKEI